MDPMERTRGSKGDGSFTPGVEDVTTNQLIGPRVSGQAGGRKVAPSRVETDRVGSAGTDPAIKAPSHRAVDVTRR